MARRALVGLVVREGDGAGVGVVAPAAAACVAWAEGDSRVGCYGNSTIRCLDYGAAVCGR